MKIDAKIVNELMAGAGENEEDLEFENDSMFAIVEQIKNAKE